MYRTHNCNELRISDAGREVSLAGWVHRIRNFGGMIFIDLRDRYGITQLVFNPDQNNTTALKAAQLGRESVIQVKGMVVERSNKNKNIPTGDIEISAEELLELNASNIPPFTIEDETDGG